MKKKQRTVKAGLVKPNELGHAIKLILRLYDTQVYGSPEPALDEYGAVGDNIKVEKPTFRALVLVKEVEVALANLAAFTRSYPGLNGCGIAGDGKKSLCELTKHGEFAINCANFESINEVLVDNLETPTKQ